MAGALPKQRSQPPTTTDGLSDLSSEGLYLPTGRCFPSGADLLREAKAPNRLHLCASRVQTHQY